MTTTADRSLDRKQFPRVAAFLDAYAEGPGQNDDSVAFDLRHTIDRAAVTTAPFEVATIDEFLPPELYNAVLDEWHTYDIKPVNLPGSKYVGSRQGTRLMNWTRDEPGTSTATWGKLADVLRSASFTSALFTRFAPTVEANLSHPDVADAATAGFMMWANQDHGADEALGAHIDGLHKLLTIVLYLDLQGPTTPDSNRLWGTTLYDIEPDSLKTVDFSPNAAHRPAGVVEFRPNRAFVMPNSSNALHGVAGGQEGVTRRSLMWGYWFFGDR
ncbi:hypothetical protein [Micromonospora sp. WMMA1976]|uniref:hypothetical protein n=1 Tax=Micromonospora sp. WMMA1976 TaxID=3014995 RepID=UPI00248B381C|nr:hypothetical protein [Micromonospora sp. WMMA1976]WBC01102.1 hypothetical protein O7546_18215 [Micromonospora sp. WMMA1976]